MKNIYSLMKFLLLPLFMLSSYNCGKLTNSDTNPSSAEDLEDLIEKNRKST